MNYSGIKDHKSKGLKMRLNIRTKFLSVLLVTSLLIIATSSTVNYFFEKDLAKKFTKKTITALETITKNSKGLFDASITPFTERYLNLAVDDIADEILFLLHKNKKISNTLLRSDSNLRTLINKYSCIGKDEIVRIVVIDKKEVVLSIDPAEEEKSYSYWFDICPELEKHIFHDKNDSGYYNLRINNVLTPVYLNVFQIPNTNYDVIAFLNLSKYLEPTVLANRKRLDNEILQLENTTSVFQKKSISNIGMITLITVFIIALICIPISLYFATTITKPIRLLCDRVKRIGKGNFDAKIKEQGSLEVVELIRSFNYLGEELKVYIKNLEKEITEREKVENEIKIAAKIQLSMLPEVTEEFKHKKFSISAHLDPAKEASGDFYDFFYIGENKIALIIGDVSGKGISAAIFMALSLSVIRNSCENEPDDPAIALNKANNIISSNNKEYMFVTLFLMYYNYNTGKAEYANAGHHNAIITTKDENNLDHFGKFDDSVIGFVKDYKYKKGKITLNENDTIILYTDGITEAFSPDKEEFGERRLENLIISSKELPVNEISINIVNEVRTFENNERSDDATVLVFRRKETGN